MKEISDLTKKAEKFLKTAKLVFDSKDYDSCTSRCYYAMFFMAEAVLLTKDLKASSHKGVISLFGEHFVKTGIFEREEGKALIYAYDKRLIGDYGVGFAVTEREAEDILRISQNFIKKLKIYLKK
ncbi:MAG: HEPN domain-containing protein [Candidatus Stahlbacteria bacterium]|nr:HEPN domain-containing protein [Candidatus Stahlbacteria bacterium]